MATVSNQLFSWQAVEASPEIQRFHHILAALDDHQLITALQRDRKGKRDDYPVACVWNSLLAGIVFQHPSIASLRRELLRNGELRQACGFDTLRRDAAVPSKDVYTRFFKKLERHTALVEAIFHNLIERLGALLPDFGQSLAIDGKAIPTSRKSDVDADVGHKLTACPDEEAQGQVKTETWFGYKLHMICDAKHELPIAFHVTAASEGESPHLLGLVEEIEQRHPALLERAEEISGDRGYDAGPAKATLADEYDMAALIPPRDMKDGRMQPPDPTRSDSIYVSPTGEVCCKVRPFAEPAHVYAPMQYQGYEKDRRTLKFRCPAAGLGVTCKNREACRSACKDQGFGRVARVKIDRDRRIFLPIYRHSNQFADRYKRRTSVERLFARVDHMYGFERHTIRGLKQMRLRMTMALSAMLATAVGWIQAGHAKKIRSLSPLVA